jgi:hypothetical protein
MRFTVIFDSAEAEDHSFGLVFVPCPVWVQGVRTSLNLNPESPRYEVGSVHRLLDKEQIEVGRDMPSGLLWLHIRKGMGPSRISPI